MWRKSISCTLAGVMIIGSAGLVVLGPKGYWERHLAAPSVYTFVLSFSPDAGLEGRESAMATGLRAPQGLTRRMTRAADDAVRQSDPARSGMYELGKVTSSRSADLGKLIIAVDALTRLLADAKPKPEVAQSIFHRDPHQVMEDIVDRWLAADEADRRERGLSAPIYDPETAQARIDELEAENARLRGEAPALPSPEAELIVPPGEQGKLYVGPDDHRARPGPVIDGKAVAPAPTAAEREAKRVAINNDRSAYTQQGLRPAGSELWRAHAGGVDESFFWGGSTGKRAW